MRRQLLLGLVLVGLLLQGAAAASVELLSDDVAQGHCAGAEPAPADGDCCPDEGGMSVGCAALCQAAEAPIAPIVAVRPDSPGVHRAAAEIASPNPAYVPNLPPPIA